MRASWRSLFQLASDGTTREALKGIRKTNARRVAAMREKKTTTNDYNKAQYISAFVEARSAALMHQHKVGLLEGDASNRAPSSPSELRTLAKELDEKYHHRALSTTMSNAQDAVVTAAHHTAKESPVPFGAWREVDAHTAKLQRSAHVMRHCVMREARTPPDWSPEAILDALPHQGSKPWLQFYAYLNGLQSRESIDGAKVYKRFRRFLQEVRLTADGEEEKYRPLYASYVLQRLVTAQKSDSWRAGLQFLRCYMEAEPRASADDISQQIAVYAEAVRYASAVSRPSMAEVEELLRAATTRQQKGTAEKGLRPVVAAPILSIIGEPSDKSVEAVERIAKTFLIQHGHNRKQYMPPVAWGELLRALHRCGAPLSRIQKYTDDITDPSLTQHADKLLCNPHVWNGYLAACDAAHAMEVYANRHEYGLHETPSLIAMLVEALVRDGSNDNLKQAEGLWRTLKSREGAVIIGTASVLSARIRMLRAQGCLMDLLRLAVDYDNYLVYWGIARSCWEADEAAQLYKHAEAVHKQFGVEPFVAASASLLGEKVPPAVHHLLVDCIHELSQPELSKGGEGVPELSAEMLADLL